MKYKILKNDEVINTIVASEEFCKSYCDQNGYTYESITEDDISNQSPIDPVEQLRADVDYIAVMTGVEL